MSFDDELKFEQAFVDLLRNECGWKKEIIKYPTEEDLIKNWKDILFNNNREKDVLNDCPLTDGEMNQIICLINKLKTPCALNKFINGKTVSIRRDNKDDELHFGKEVSLKIYDRDEISCGKSIYQIVEQPKFKTNNNIYPSRRGDVMLLINGMPVFHIELKKSGVGISQAVTQIEKYAENGVFTGIFSLVQIFIAMNPEEAVYFANPDGKFNENYYFHWEDFNNEIINKWHEFTKKVLYIPMAHELIGYYTIPDDADGVLKVMRSYQFYAADSIVEKVSKTNWTKHEQHGGYIWHTTGSGKTMTSFKAAQLIANSRKADKVVFLLDRVELGEQSFSTYKNYSTSSESVQSTETTAVLISKLKSNSADDVLIVTSIQKMSRIKEDGEVKLNDLKLIQSKHIVFIIDECHRDQKGEMHQNIKKTFPNAIYFGFTGTPDHSTTPDIFGNELHRYTIVHGIRDKNVLGFDPYKICTFKDKDLREQVALEMCHCSTAEEAMENEETRKVFLYFTNKGDKKCPMTEIEKYISGVQYETERHEEAVVTDILDNWIIRSVASKFHAIFATSSIPEAIKYYELFKAKDHNLNITAIFDPSDTNNSTSIAKMNGITTILNDYKEMFGNAYDIGTYDKFKKDVCLRLAHKKPYIRIKKEETINLVIVVDQLLTGFDSKWINTLYLDKKLQGKNFIQAISRTNRLYGHDKPHGTIIWYRYPHTMEEDLEKAVNEYSGNRPFGIFVDKLHKNIHNMNVLFEEIKELFESVGIEEFDHNYDDLSWKKKFAKTFSDFNKYLDAAKIQGFLWEKNTYDYEDEFGKKQKISVIFDEKTYKILVKRYQELFTYVEYPTDVPYDIDSYITEIQTDAIDDEYMNSKFELYMLNLDIGDKESKEKLLSDLYSTFAALSQEEQDFAKMIISDIESGKLAVEKGKTFRDYITTYKCNSYNSKIEKLARRLGLYEDKLRELLERHVDEKNINAYGKYDELISTMDIEKAKDFMEELLGKKLSKREAKIEADNLLRSFILNNDENMLHHLNYPEVL